MNPKKPYVKPVLEKRERLADVTQSTPAVVTGAPP